MEVVKAEIASLKVDMRVAGTVVQGLEASIWKLSRLKLPLSR